MSSSVDTPLLVRLLALVALGGGWRTPTELSSEEFKRRRAEFDGLGGRKSMVRDIPALVVSNL
jgi:hypothetical protein